MLLVFAFSIMPKLFLHDLFAGHVDYVHVKKTNAPFRVDPAGFNCDKDGVVATSPFLADEPAVVYYTFIPFSPYTPEETALSSANKIYYPLRGPPAEIFS